MKKQKGFSLWFIVGISLFVYFLYYSFTTVACSSKKSSYVCLNKSPVFLEFKDQTLDLYQTLLTKAEPYIVKAQEKVRESPLTHKVEEFVSKATILAKEAVETEQGQAALKLHRTYVEPNVMKAFVTLEDAWDRSSKVFVHEFIPRAVVQYDVVKRLVDLRGSCIHYNQN
jgi:hypothetical protein